LLGQSGAAETYDGWGRPNGPPLEGPLGPLSGPLLHTLWGRWGAIGLSFRNFFSRVIFKTELPFLLNFFLETRGK